MASEGRGFGPDQFEPDYALPPGATLRDVINAMGMSQSELALRTGLSLKHVNQIIQGVAPVTHETALALEKVTGVPARFWNSLEVIYRDRQARLRQAEISEADRAWLNSLPVRELAERGKLDANSDAAALLQQVCRFFGVANREIWERVWRAPLAAFRRSPSFVSDRPALASWLRLGELDAAEIRCQPFNAKNFRASLREIRLLTRADPETFSKEVIRICAESGVAVVFISEIKGCRASGAAHWLSPSKAVIQLSDRHKRDDHLWFSFFHEAGHLLLHSKKETFVTNDALSDLAEEEANVFAATTLIPKSKEPLLAELETPSEIEEFAEQLGIAPGIVVGRMQREDIIPWSRFNSLKRKVRIVGDADDED